MADHASASMTIGGILPRALLIDLCEAIAEDGLCVDYGGRPIEQEDIISGVPLEGAACEVRGAMFESTEAFCRKHGLRYRRRSDACPGVWDPGLEIYPGTGVPRCFDTSVDGDITVTREDIRRLGSLAAIEAHFAAAAVDTGPLVIVGMEDTPPAIG